MLTTARRSRSRASRHAWLCLFAACIALLPPRGAAAERWSALAETVFQNYGRDQGLPHPVVTALAQDHDGLIWFGTQGGLARWDGYRFHAYKADRGTPGSLPDDWIQTLHVDAAGQLWIGSSAGGLSRYERDSDRFTPVALPSSNGRVHIGAIIDDGSGGLWVGSDEGLHHIVGLQATTPNGAPPGAVRALLRERDGALWVGTTQGLWHRANGRAPFTAVPLPDAGGVTALFTGTDGRLWIGTLRHGVFAIDQGGDAARAIGAGDAFASASVSAICGAGPHEIWVGLRIGGIVAIDTRSMELRPIRHDRTLSNSLAHDDVWALLQDSVGSIWVGGTGGLSYHARDSGLIETVFGAAGRGDGLSGSDVLSVLATRSGRVWLGYYDGGADLVDPLRGRISALPADISRNARTLPPDPVLAMVEGADGTVYFGTRRGLYAGDSEGHDLHRVGIAGRDPQASVGALAFDAGVLWLGGESDGVWGIDSGGRAIDTNSRIVFGPADSRKLSDVGIDVILRGHGNDLWIGTRNGLDRLDLVTHAVERMAPNAADATALPAPFVMALAFDQRDRLWVGTFGGGLAMLDGRDTEGRPRFRRFGLAEGLPHLNVDSVQVDGGGVIWVGTDDGLARIDPQTLAIHALHRADGAVLLDYLGGAGATERDGTALFGALRGLTVVRPGAMPQWQQAAPVVISDLRVGGRRLPVGRYNGTGAVLDVQPQANSLAVEFAALDYSSPERNRYAYRLDGFDNDWTEADASRRLAVYGNLPPGDYTLRLRGSNREGQWSDRELSLPIRVLPAWYQHWWVRALGVAALIAIVVLLFRRRTAFLRRRQAELEWQIAERTADLSAANERLERLAMTDPLTGCANRRHFVERARALITLANRHDTPLSLAVLDLDAFKQINDTHGHPAGDAVLAMAGGTIVDSLRSTDLVGRIGGEEFAVLMPHTASAGAQLLAERLRTAIAAGSVANGNGTIRITASLGVAELRSGEDFESLYARADAALYAAKESGRNRVRLETEPA